MAHRNRWFSQLETSMYKGFSIAMLNNQMLPFVINGTSPPEWLVLPAGRGIVGFLLMASLMPSDQWLSIPQLCVNIYPVRMSVAGRTGCWASYTSFCFLEEQRNQKNSLLQLELRSFPMVFPWFSHSSSYTTTQLGSPRHRPWIGFTQGFNSRGSSVHLDARFSPL